MLIDNPTIRKNIKRKMSFIVLMVASTVCAFATLGDGKGKEKPKSLLSAKKTVYNPGTFSLKSGYNFRGSHIINEETNNYIFLNTTLTYQKGNTTYILPLKRKLLLDKIKFNPSSKGLY